MAKRAQAAMEFLMTYGWAILVVLVVIGALAYFGVLNPSSMLPSKCTTEMGLSCSDYRITNNSITVKLLNGRGQDIVVRNITFKSDYITSSNGCTWSNVAQAPGYSVNGTVIKNGESKVFIANGSSCTVSEFSNKGRFLFDITWSNTNYKNESEQLAFLHTMSGNELLAPMEK